MANTDCIDFVNISDAYSKKIDNIRKCFDEMTNAYNKCEAFANNTSKPNHGKLSVANQDKALCNEFKVKLQKWQDANKDLLFFIQNNLNLNI